MDQALPRALSGKHQAGSEAPASESSDCPKVFAAVGLEATIVPFCIIRDPGYPIRRISAKISFEIIPFLIFLSDPQKCLKLRKILESMVFKSLIRF